MGYAESIEAVRALSKCVTPRKPRYRKTEILKEREKEKERSFAVYSEKGENVDSCVEDKKLAMARSRVAMRLCDFVARSEFNGEECLIGRGLSDRLIVRRVAFSLRKDFFHTDQGFFQVFFDQAMSLLLKCRCTYKFCNDDKFYSYKERQPL